MNYTCINAAREYAVSPASQLLGQELSKIYEHNGPTISLNWRRGLQDELAETWRNCSVEDWDGYGAEPISLRSYQATAYLIELLPENLLMPDIVPEPSGEMGLEWRNGRDFAFVMSVSDEKLIYVGILGGDRQRGAIEMTDKLPSVVLSILRNSFSKNDDA